MIYAGLDLGGTKCAAVLAEAGDGAIRFLARKEVKTQGDWQDVVNPLAAFLLEESAGRGVKLAGCGVSCGGPLDGQAGRILNPPNLMRFENVEITAWAEQALGCPARLQNDADACALAEWRFGAGQGTSNMIFLTFGTGLGAGLILGGRLHTGARNLAGEVGHIRLEPDGPVGYRKAGSFEGFCSGGGIRQFIALRTGEAGDARSLFNRAEQGDTAAIALWREIGLRFGRGLAVLVDILNPEAVVAGSIFARAHKYLYAAAMEGLAEEALPESLHGFRLLPAALGDRIGDYAAIAIAATDG
ncbi:MAG: ROK family protein [Oscillospiraceae bacterium]|jgi:glucokinase|nr:ROK family protein [Oscillospiraceae bacterium]